MGYSEEEAHLLGYSTALLYALFKAKAQKKERPEKEAKKEIPKELRALKTQTVEFGGQQYEVVKGKGKRLEKSIVGHEAHEAAAYHSEVQAKFPEGWHERLAKERVSRPGTRAAGEGPGRPSSAWCPRFKSGRSD